MLPWEKAKQVDASRRWTISSPCQSQWQRISTWSSRWVWHQPYNVVDLLPFDVGDDLDLRANSSQRRELMRDHQGFKLLIQMLEWSLKCNNNEPWTNDSSKGKEVVRVTSNVPWTNDSSKGKKVVRVASNIPTNSSLSHRMDPRNSSHVSEPDPSQWGGHGSIGATRIACWFYLLVSQLEIRSNKLMLST